MFYHIRSTYMMLLLLGVASLVGIVSAATTYHFFGVGVVAQGQGGPGPQQPIQSQKLGQQILSPQQQQPPLSIQQMQLQRKQDMELLDRIFPDIIQRIDGKTLAQKIDAATLIQKIDAKTLAAKVLPFLDIKVVTVQRPGATHNIDVTGFIGKIYEADSSCAPEETLISGGFNIRGDRPEAPNRFIQEPSGPSSKWVTAAGFSQDGSIQTFAECLKAELALKPPQVMPR